MGDFQQRRLGYQRYNSKDENAMVRLGDVIDCFPSTLSVSGATTLTGATGITGALTCAGAVSALTLTATTTAEVATTLSVDTINEYTSGAGVSISNELAVISESVTTVLTAAQSGAVFFVNADTATATYTLPTPKAGLKFKWIFTGDCNNATVIQTADNTDTTGDMFEGGLMVFSAAAVITYVEPGGADINTLTVDDNVNDRACGAGSWIEIYCTEDPTWVVTGVLNGNTDVDGDGSAMFSDAD